MKRENFTINWYIYIDLLDYFRILVYITYFSCIQISAFLNLTFVPMNVIFRIGMINMFWNSSFVDRDNKLTAYKSYDVRIKCNFQIPKMESSKSHHLLEIKIAKIISYIISLSLSLKIRKSSTLNLRSTLVPIMCKIRSYLKQTYFNEFMSLSRKRRE